MGICSTESGFLVRVCDKLSRLSTFTSSGTLKVDNESYHDAVIDIINYMTHAGGLKVSKKGIAAVGASKFVQGVLPSIGPIQLPTGTAATSSIGSNPSSGAPI